MKNVILITAILISALSFSQRGEKRMQARESMTPQQEASIKSKKMALELDLTEKQQVQVFDLLKEQASNRPERLSKEAREKMSQDERLKAKEARLDDQIALKRELKNILNEEQYEKLEKMMDKRKKGAKKKIKERRANQ